MLHQFTHYFENPYGYQNVQNSVVFHFHLFSAIYATIRPRKIEKINKKVFGTFLRPHFSKNKKMGKNIFNNNVSAEFDN